MHPIHRLLPSLAVITALLLAGCLSPEQRMVIKIDKMMERQQFDGALSYLDAYLGKHDKSLTGWRYRVLIRLEQGERATAAAEYARLNEALARHEPEVLRDVVLGGGGQWLLSDYRALARCAPQGVADVAFFADLLAPKHMGEGSMSKIAVSEDVIAAVIDALPGRLAPSETWPIVAGQSENRSLEMQAKVAAAAARHLVSEGLTAKQAPEAMGLLRAAAAAADPALREIALLGTLGLPEGPGLVDFTAATLSDLLDAGDVDRAIGLLLTGPRGAGPLVWTDEQLTVWAETAQEPVRVLAVAVLASRPEGATKARMKLLDRAAASSEIGTRLAAVAAGSLLDGWVGAPALTPTWGALDVVARRRWAAVFVRSEAPDAGAWATAVLGDTDAVVVQSAIRALALPGAGADATVDAALQAAMEGTDPSTRAIAAATAVIRGAQSLANPVGALLARGDDRATEAVLLALKDNGDGRWEAAVKLGMESAVPTLRELAVDAAVASCDAGRTEQMFALLRDEDPHVAVRAAAALYLLIGGS